MHRIAQAITKFYWQKLNFNDKNAQAENMKLIMKNPTKNAYSNKGSCNFELVSLSYKAPYMKRNFIARFFLQKESI